MMEIEYSSILNDNLQNEEKQTKNEKKNNSYIQFDNKH